MIHSLHPSCKFHLIHKKKQTTTKKQPPNSLHQTTKKQKLYTVFMINDILSNLIASNTENNNPII